jgi:hypothetical protein
MQLTAFGTKTMLCSDFQNVDQPCDMLKGHPSLRTLILDMKTRPSSSPTASTLPPSSTGPLFLSVDAATSHRDRGSYTFTYTVDNAIEAEEKIKNLLSYLDHSYGSSAALWFLPPAMERADGMKWDDATDRPISAFEEELDGILDDDDLDWVANLEDKDKTFQAAKVEISLQRPSLLRKVSNNPLAGEADSVVTFHQPGVNHLPSSVDGDNSVCRDAAMDDNNSSAGGSEGSLAGAV